MKKREGISWILDRPHAEIEELKSKYSNHNDYMKHSIAYNEETDKKRIDFVHSRHEKTAIFAQKRARQIRRARFLRCVNRVLLYLAAAEGFCVVEDNPSPPAAELPLHKGAFFVCFLFVCGINGIL